MVTKDTVEGVNAIGVEGPYNRAGKNNVLLELEILKAAICNISVGADRGGYLDRHEGKSRFLLLEQFQNTVDRRGCYLVGRQCCEGRAGVISGRGREGV